MAGFFGFFDYSKPGRGVSKEEVGGPPFIVFWQVLGRKWTKLIQLNLLYILCTLPVIALAFLFAPIAPEVVGEESILSLYMYQIGATLYIAVVGCAPICCGIAYVLRNFAREEHAFVLSDFLEQIKLNWKQSLPLWLMDLAVTYVIFVAYNFYSINAELGTIYAVAQWLVVAAGVIYFLMHFYLYQLIVTFDMKFKQLLRNAFMLVLAKLPFNLLLLFAMIGIGLLAYGWGAWIGFAVFALFGTALLSYIANFYANNVIYKLLIEPQLPPEENYDSAFKD